MPITSVATSSPLSDSSSLLIFSTADLVCLDSSLLESCSSCVQDDVDVVEDEDSDPFSSALYRDDCNCNISMCSGHDNDVDEEGKGWL